MILNDTTRDAMLDDSVKTSADFIRQATRAAGLFPKAFGGRAENTVSGLLTRAAAEFDRLNGVASNLIGEGFDAAPTWSLPERLRMLAESIDKGEWYVTTRDVLNDARAEKERALVDADVAHADALVLRRELAAERAAHADAVRSFLHAQTEGQAARASNARLLGIVTTLVVQMAARAESGGVRVQFCHTLDFGGAGLTPAEASDVLTALELAGHTQQGGGTQRDTDGGTPQ